MKFIPVLFSTPMVQAILEGRKTMTRRTVKADHVLCQLDINDHVPEYFHNSDWCPYGQPGDVLWVRESFSNLNADFKTDPYWIYKADMDHPDQHGPVTWKPSIHMPKSLCRIFPEVTDVRVERLQDVSEVDAIAEGLQYYNDLGSRFYRDYIADASGYGHPDHDFPTVSEAKASFSTLWQSINGEKSWDENPWVWVISFKRIDKPENFNP